MPYSRLSAARVNPSQVPLKFTKVPEVSFVWGLSGCGQKKDGPQTAPPVLCAPDFLEDIAGLEWTTNIRHAPQASGAATEGEGATKIYEPQTVAQTCDKVHEQFSAALSVGQFPVLVGGDHCLAIGSASACAKHFAKKGQDACLLWFGAHADINTAATTTSGNMNGMPIAGLLGLPDLCKIVGFEDGRFTSFPRERIAWIGIRDIDDGEKETLKALGVNTAFYMEDVNEHGMARVLEMALEKINPDLTRPIHLSFDVEGMDPMDAPSTGTPVAGGVRLHEAINMVRTLRATGCLASMDIVEINPCVGSERDLETTIVNSRMIVAHALGAAVCAPASPMKTVFVCQ